MDIMNNREIEVRFLEINQAELISKLRDLGAEDLGEDLTKETIFYDRAGEWRQTGKTFVRIRKTKRGTLLTYKNVEVETALGVEEIELAIGDDIEKAQSFLEAIGLVLVRDQEKKRHTFKLGDVTVDIDTWPQVPTYVELEGPSEDAIQEASSLLGFDYAKGIFSNAMLTIEKYYKIPVRDLRYFTFGRVE